MSKDELSTASGTNRKTVFKTKNETKTKKQNRSCVSPTVSSGSVSLGSSGSDTGPAAELVSTAAADDGAVTSCKHTHTHTH